MTDSMQGVEATEPLDLSLLDSPYLKDGKLHYLEPKLRPETHQLVAHNLLTFRTHRQLLEQKVNVPPTADDKEAITKYIQSYSAVIAMLVQDSDETLTTLAHRINELMSPFNRMESASDLFQSVIEQVIRTIATRQKYGLVPSETTASIPTTLTMTRWEVADVSMFPEDYKTLLSQRREQRKVMTQQLTEHCLSLPQLLQNHLFSSKSRKPEPKAPEELAASELEKRRKKHEEKLKRDEEKKKKEEERQEEKRRREQDKKKKEQSQLRLTSLFSKNAEGKSTASSSPSSVDHVQVTDKMSIFPPFFVKEHVNMFNVGSIQESSPDILNLIHAYSTDPSTKAQMSDELRQRYLQELEVKQPALTKPRGISRKVDLRQLMLSDTACDLGSIYRPENKVLLRMKLLQFTEDVRPAYYGTWTKLSSGISPKNPFKKDDKLIDYEHDSEAEWEPEGEGEDIRSGDEDEDDMAPEVTDPDDVGWLVPEGYLSEGEGMNDSDEEDGMSKIVQRLSVRPKSRKNLNTRPIVVGPCFDDDEDAQDYEPLKPFAIHFLTNINEQEGYDPFAVIEKRPAGNTDHDDSNRTSNSNSNSHNNKSSGFTSEHEIALINIIEGKPDGLPKLLSEAKSNSLLCDFPKTQIEAKIKDIAIKEKRGNDTRSTWYPKQK